MQLLHAYARDPGFRPEAVEKAQSIAPMLTGQLAGNAGAAYTRAAQALMVGNDPRFQMLPSDSDLAHVNPQDLPALLKQPLAGQADVVMVGDVSVADAIKATQDTFGGGAAAKRPSPATAHVTIAASGGAPLVVEHTGRPDQAFYGEYFPLPDYFADPKTSVTANVAAAIISSRLVDTVREQLGITYSPQVQAITADDLPGEGYLGITLETPPANFAKFHSLMAEQISQLAAKPVSADELARAKQPLIETERKQRETNAFWLARLELLARDPRAKSETVEAEQRMSAVTAADVQQLMARFASRREPAVVIARAKGLATPAAAASTK
jgi:zinc protease